MTNEIVRVVIQDFIHQILSELPVLLSIFIRRYSADRVQNRLSPAIAEWWHDSRGYCTRSIHSGNYCQIFVCNFVHHQSRTNIAGFVVPTTIQCHIRKLSNYPAKHELKSVFQGLYLDSGSITLSITINTHDLKQFINIIIPQRCVLSYRAEVQDLNDGAIEIKE